MPAGQIAAMIRLVVATILLALLANVTLQDQLVYARERERPYFIPATERDRLHRHARHLYGRFHHLADRARAGRTLEFDQPAPVIGAREDRRPGKGFVHAIDDAAKARGISREEVVRDVLLAAQPNKRFAEVEELGALAVFLCGPGGRSITGTALPVDGGWTAH